MRRKRVKTRKYQDDFGVTFGVSFFLTLFAVPFVVAGSGQEEVSGGAFVVFFVGGLVIAIPMFAKAIIISAFIFFPLYHLISLIAARRIAFVLAAVPAGFLSAALSMVVNVDIFPPDLTLNGRIGSFEMLVGSVAAAVAGFVATVQVMTSDLNA